MPRCPAPRDRPRAVPGAGASTASGRRRRGCRSGTPRSSARVGRSVASAGRLGGGGSDSGSSSSESGCEGAARTAGEHISAKSKGSAPYVIVKLDAHNAFNEIRREEKSSRPVFGHGVLTSIILCLRRTVSQHSFPSRRTNDTVGQRGRARRTSRPRCLRGSCEFLCARYTVPAQRVVPRRRHQCCSDGNSQMGYFLGYVPPYP